MKENTHSAGSFREASAEPQAVAAVLNGFSSQIFNSVSRNRPSQHTSRTTIQNTYLTLETRTETNDETYSRHKLHYIIHPIPTTIAVPKRTTSHCLTPPQPKRYEMQMSMSTRPKGYRFPKTQRDPNVYMPRGMPQTIGNVIRSRANRPRHPIPCKRRAHDQCRDPHAVNRREAPLDFMPIVLATTSRTCVLP